MMEHNKMTQSELYDRRTEIFQLLMEPVTLPPNTHKSELEDEIKIIDDQLKKFED